MVTEKNLWKNSMLIRAERRKSAQSSCPTTTQRRVESQNPNAVAERAGLLFKSIRAAPGFSPGAAHR